MKPCENLLIVDFSSLLPGPLVSLMFAELGAEVVKIERPEGGDDMRGFEPRWGQESVNFALLNRGKRSVTLDLKQDTAGAQLRALLERADILIEQFRPGVMERLGLSYESVKAVNSDIIYCSITGYGQFGPMSLHAGHDLNYLAQTGLLSLSHGAPAAPVVPPALIADIAGGSYPAMINILLALSERDRGRSGRHLDVSMSDNLFPFMYWALGNKSALAALPKCGGDLVTGGSPRYKLYRTADDRLLAAAPLEDRFWERFCDAIQLEASLRQVSADWDVVGNRVAALIAANDSAHWSGVFSKVECCCCVVSTLEEALANPHFRARGLFDDAILGPDGAFIPALPLPIDASFRTPAGVTSSPTLGANNDLYLSRPSQYID